MNVSIDIDMDDLWGNLEDYVTHKIADYNSDADYITRGDVLAECEDAFYEMIVDYDFSAQFDYYMEDYDFAAQDKHDEIEKIWAEFERRTLKGRAKRVADWFGKLTRKVHWYMPRR